MSLRQLLAFKFAIYLVKKKGKSDGKVAIRIYAMFIWYRETYRHRERKKMSECVKGEVMDYEMKRKKISRADKRVKICSFYFLSRR